MIEEFGGRWHDVLPSAESARTSTTAPPVIALHCSGADGRQWRKLADALAPRFKLFAIDCYGCESTGAWPGERAFTLADEARRVVDLIDKLGTAVHLVGHSYGGGVMLRVAIERPAAVASLTLYEPSAFHLLSQLGPSGLAAQEEILRLTRTVCWGVVSGDYHTAVSCFVDYWNGAGSSATLRPHVRADLLRWLPKAPLDFQALLCERTPLAAYRQLVMPTLVLRGEHAPRPSRLIASGLTRVMRTARLRIVPNAGHMGPFTHADDVNTAIAGHLESVAAAGERSTCKLVSIPDPIAA